MQRSQLRGQKNRVALGIAIFILIIAPLPSLASTESLPYPSPDEEVDDFNQIKAETSEQSVLIENSEDVYAYENHSQADRSPAVLGPPIYEEAPLESL